MYLRHKNKITKGTEILALWNDSFGVLKAISKKEIYSMYWNNQVTILKDTDYSEFIHPPCNFILVKLNRLSAQETL